MLCIIPFLSILGFTVVGLNEVPNPVEAVEKAQGIFVGGGNTFLLLKTLQDKQLIEPIRRQVLEKVCILSRKSQQPFQFFNVNTRISRMNGSCYLQGAPYMGISAGTNMSTIGINTTNDMPIVHPKSLSALGLVDFHINPHYLDTDPDSTHKGVRLIEHNLNTVELLVSGFNFNAGNKRDETQRVSFIVHVSASGAWTARGCVPSRSGRHSYFGRTEAESPIRSVSTKLSILTC